MYGEKYICFVKECAKKIKIILDYLSDVTSSICFSLFWSSCVNPVDSM